MPRVRAPAAAPASDTARRQELVFAELMRECRQSPPGARLSARLRAELERMSPAERSAVVRRKRDGCAPLFVAARRGNAEMTEYLVHVCCAELEQRGEYEVPDERAAHTVTPLWAAAVAGRLDVLRVLADAGAELDAASGSGSTPVRSACFMTHLDVVRFLARRGADLQRPNHNGGTCLINAVQSVRLCAFLLQHGAAVDAQDMQLKTALHYAIQEHRVETARLLLQHGADPHLESRAGDDALRTACLKGAPQLVAMLAAREDYPPARLADAYELLGATQLDEFNDVALALGSWRRATALRQTHGVRKALGDAAPALGGAIEWEGVDELEAAATDMDALRAQSLLVTLRVLGPAHKDTVLRLMYRGAAYGDAFRYQRCVDLWGWALELRVERESLLAAEATHAACALTRLMLDAHGGRLQRARGVPRPQDAARLLRLLLRDLPVCQRALQARPVHRRQAETFDRALRCATHLLHLLQATADDEEQRAQVTELARELVAAGLRSSSTGDTPLHLCVSRLNMIRGAYFAEAAPAPLFPSASVARLLLSAGARVNARNEARSTPLHVAAIPYNFSTELVQALLEGGAHLDQPNRFGDSPAALVALNRASRVRVLQHVSLACLAARALLTRGVAARDLPLPSTLRNFVALHEP